MPWEPVMGILDGCAAIVTAPGSPERPGSLPRASWAVVRPFHPSLSQSLVMPFVRSFGVAPLGPFLPSNRAGFGGQKRAVSGGLTLQFILKG